MNSSDDIVIIKPKKQNPLIMIAAVILISIWAYLRLQCASRHPGHLYWVRVAFLIVIWVALVSSLVYRKRNPEAGNLKLTPMGLFRGGTLYRWHEIEQFGITGPKGSAIPALFQKKTIYWNLKQSSSSRGFSNKLSNLLAGYDVSFLATNYDMPAEDLVKMLNDRKTRYTGHFSDIKYSGGLSRNLTKRELIGIAVGIALVLLAAILLVNLTGPRK